MFMRCLRKFSFIFTFVFLAFAFCTKVFAQDATVSYSFGDMKSETLVSKAWDALAKNDLNAVLAYTNKTIELYAEEAQKMQASLTAYPTEKEKIFSYWALNDVATALFIQGEAYRRADKKDEAKAAFDKLMKNFSYGQTWDNGGWFWKPAEAAKEKMANMGLGLDFGDGTSSFLVGQAWRSLSKEEYANVYAYTDKVISTYSEQAKTMQQSLKEYPWQSKEVIFKYWALNDVGTAYYIRGMAFKKEGKAKEAKESFGKLTNEYFYAQCWDPAGWFWKPSEAAQQEVGELESENS